MKKFSILAATAAALVLASGSPATAQRAQGGQAVQPAAIDGKPNLNGIWQTFSRASASGL